MSWCRAPSRACAGKFPNLLIDVDILKIEEAVDYLLLGKGEVVAMSSRYEHPMLTFEPLAQGTAAVHRAGRPSARPARARLGRRHRRVSADRHRSQRSLRADHGRHLRAARSLAYEVTIKARFGSTVCALVRNGLGIAVIDEFTVAGGNWPGIRAIPIVGADGVPDLHRLSARMRRCRATANSSSPRCAGTCESPEQAVEPASG